jgi:hypothetical protein
MDLLVKMVEFQQDQLLLMVVTVIVWEDLQV